jgi:anti-anti-sigma factor
MRVAISGVSQSKVRVWLSHAASSYVVVHVAGDVDYSVVEAVQERLMAVADALARPVVVLELSELGFCDWAGLNRHLRVYATCEHALLQMAA